MHLEFVCVSRLYLGCISAVVHLELVAALPERRHPLLYDLHHLTDCTAKLVVGHVATPWLVVGTGT